MDGSAVIDGGAAILIALLYLLALFAVAHWGDGAGARLVRGPWYPTVYALALAVYCTSWTFYGSVGLATRSGLDFLTVYAGPILIVGLGRPLLARIVRIARAQNSTSIADFVAARYGKSEAVAALVTGISVLGAMPYIALQLKAVAASLDVLLRAGEPGGAAGLPAVEDLALAVAVVMAGFAVAFGTRSAAATEHQSGLVLAVAAESVVKLVAFLAVGLFVWAAIVGGSGPLPNGVAGLGGTVAGLAGGTSGPVTLLTLTALSACAAVLLPRQFHVAVVENRSEADLRRAAWLFPAYLVGINLFVLPLAAAGLGQLAGPDVDRDMTVLALPLASGSGALALLTFIGGLSASTAMVIVETVALSIMLSSHVAVPLLLRLGRFRAGAGASADLGRAVLRVRRLAIVAVTLFGYLYHRFAGDEALAAIGFLSFAAAAQIAPAFFGGLLWRRGTAPGALAGMALGTLAWGYTLLIPALLREGSGLVVDGPFGMEALRPTALFGIDLGPFVHGTLWSIGLNAAAYLLVSLARPPATLERLGAAIYVGGAGGEADPTLEPPRMAVSRADLQVAVARFLGEERTAASFASFARSRGLAPAADGGPDGHGPADMHHVRYAEHLLASAIGASSARLALSQLLRRRNLSGEDALRLLDDASAAIQQNRDLLQHALDHAQQGINVLDREGRLLCWNHAYEELYDFPREFVRIGVPLDELVRINAERGAYGAGDVEDLVAWRLHGLVHEPGPLRLRLETTGRVISTRTSRLPGGGLFITYTDVTALANEEAARDRETEDLEARVRERTEELTRLNAALVRAKQEADEANASKTRFLAAASHDILQPLNAARLYATALRDAQGNGEHAVLAENVDQSLEAVEEILTTLLEISRLDAGEFRPRMTAVPVADLFSQLAREFGPAAADKGLRLRFVPTGLCVRSDRTMLRRLLRNLVSNAVKYTPAGTVLVGVRRRGGAALVCVHDTGLGIPDAQRRTVFREFSRLPEGARVAAGLGLGLSIVERIGRALAANVDLRSRPGRGSTFSVLLPLAAGGPPPERPRPAGPAARPRTRLDGLPVLAVDNEPAVRAGMEALLSGWGCRVRLAASLAEASEACRGGQPPRVVIADYQLDDGDGLQVIRAVREACGATLPAVLATADRSPALRDEAAAAGVIVLLKPVKPGALRAVLGRVGTARVDPGG